MLAIGRSTPTPRRGTILAIDDEVRSQRLLRVNLEPLGYRLIMFAQMAGVVDAVEAQQPDLILLDLQLPDGDGYELCHRIREVSVAPIMILSAWSQAAHKVRGFDAGADDYVTKPYDPTELGARIDAMLRRVQGLPLQRQRAFRCGPLVIDFEQRLVTLNGDEVRLSRTEYRLLECLALNAGRTLVADVLLNKVWGPEYMGDYASLHLYVSRLRHKLGESSHEQRFVITKAGIGYFMPTKL